MKVGLKVTPTALELSGALILLIKPMVFQLFCFGELDSSTDCLPSKRENCCFVFVNTMKI